MRALPLAMAVLATALPAAEAQAPYCGAVMALCQTTTSLVVAPPEEPVPPGGDALVLPMGIEYSYPPTGLAFAPTPIRLQVTQAPPWLAATVLPSTVFAAVQPVGQCACQQVAYANAFLYLRAASDAPAFTDGIVEVAATAEPNGAMVGSTGSVQVPIEVAYLGLLDLQVPAPQAALRPRDGTIVPLLVANLGNALTRVSFEVAGAPPGVQVTLPGELTLPSRLESRDSARTVAFGLEARGAYTAGDVVLLAKPAYAPDPSWKGLPARLVLHVAPPGQASGVQTLGAGAEPLEPLTWGLLAAGAAGVALLERARRRKSR